MQSPTTFSGEVSNVWSSDAKSDKKPMARVTLKWREFAGSNPDGTPRFRDGQVCLVGWEKKADSLAKLKPGDRIVAEGKCQAGQPYKSKTNDKMYASLECHITNWEPMAVAGITGSTSSSASSGAEPELEDDGDQFAF
jgi:hypothetical protein